MTRARCGSNLSRQVPSEECEPEQLEACKDCTCPDVCLRLGDWEAELRGVFAAVLSKKVSEATAGIRAEQPSSRSECRLPTEGACFGVLLRPWWAFHLCGTVGKPDPEGAAA